MGLAHRSLVSPCRSFFLFPPLLSLFFFQNDSLEHRSFIAFCVNQRRSSLFLSLFTFLITYAIILRVPLDSAGAGPQQQSIQRAFEVAITANKSTLIQYHFICYASLLTVQDKNVMVKNIQVLGFTDNNKNKKISVLQQLYISDCFQNRFLNY